MTIDEAAVAILQADPTMRLLAGKSTGVGLCVEWETLATAAMPVCTLSLDADLQSGESGDHRPATLLVACWADGEHGGKATARRLAERAEVLLGAAGSTNFYTQGLDVGPVRWGNGPQPTDTELDRALHRHDLTLELVHKLS